MPDLALYGGIAWIEWTCKSSERSSATIARRGCSREVRWRLVSCISHIHFAGPHLCLECRMLRYRTVSVERYEFSLDQMAIIPCRRRLEGCGRNSLHVVRSPGGGSQNLRNRLRLSRFPFQYSCNVAVPPGHVVSGTVH